MQMHNSLSIFNCHYSSMKIIENDQAMTELERGAVAPMGVQRSRPSTVRFVYSWCDQDGVYGGGVNATSQLQHSLGQSP